MAAEALLAAARAAMSRAYAPYSRFPVGAALRAEGGEIYSGCNVENACYPEGWCAETTALGAFVMGGGGRIAEIAVVAGKAERVVPCGGCLQRLSEFVAADARLHLCGPDGVVETIAFSSIFPRAFELENEQ